MWPRKAVFAGALALAAITALPAVEAAQYSVVDYRGRKALVLDGDIDRDESKKFDQALSRAGAVEEIILNSGGGIEIEGLAIGRTIRKRGLGTRITSRGMCASSCADIFLGGVSRRVEKGGRYGIHMATVARNPEAIRLVAASVQATRQSNDPKHIQNIIFQIETFSAQAAARWAGYVLEMGASPRIVDLGTKTGADDMNFLNQAQLNDLNVVNVDE